MIPIGTIARLAGVTPRMLRHWQERGLVAPAAVGPDGTRGYELRQLGAVRAVTDLREAGVGLDDIAVILDPASTAAAVDGALAAHEATLDAEARTVAARSALVAARRAGIAVDRDAASRAEIGPLAALDLVAVREAVAAETEIPGAVARLLGALPESSGDIVLEYDGHDPARIVVTAGVPGATGEQDEFVRGAGADASESRSMPDSGAPSADPAAVERLTLPASERAMSARWASAPASTSDAWLALDEAAAALGLETTGPYRQTFRRDGGVLLQAPVVDLTAGCGP